MKAFLHDMLLQFFYIVAGTYIGTVLCCTLFIPDAVLDVAFLWKLLLFSLLADLPALVYYSKKELTRRQEGIRAVIHTALLLMVLMLAGHSFGMYSGVLGGLAFAFVILCVDGFVRWMSYAKDARTASEINQRLRERTARNDGKE